MVLCTTRIIYTDVNNEVSDTYELCYCVFNAPDEEIRSTARSLLLFINLFDQTTDINCGMKKFHVSRNPTSDRRMTESSERRKKVFDNSPGIGAMENLLTANYPLLGF